MRSTGIVAISFCLCTTVAIPQVAVPPPPKPADSGPSLEATMQYLQQKLSSLGKVSYVSPWHNMTDGTDGSNTFIEEVSNVSANAGSCQINYHKKVTRDGTVIKDGDFWVPLKEARDVTVEPIELSTNRANAAEGKPNLIAAAASPPMTALTVRRQNANVNVFNLIDPDMADRLAKAFTHAIELCGGGNKELF